MKNLSSKNYGQLKALAQVTPVIKKITKSKTEEEVRELFTNKEKLKEFAVEIHNALPINIKNLIELETLQALIEHNKTQALKKKNNQKKVFGIFKKKENKEDLEEEDEDTEV